MRIKKIGSCIIVFITAFSSGVFAGDIAKGKVRAAACIGCHGSNGIGLSGEYPNLAGQKKAYLIKQLRDFKRGVRANPSMKAMVAGLNDTDIINLAAYYSSLSRGANAGSGHKAIASGKADRKVFPEVVYISMKKNATIQTFPRQAVWKGGPNMLYTAVTPNGKMILSTSPSSNAVYIFNASSGQQLAVIKVGKAPKGVKVTPDGKFAYVSNQGSANISVVDLEKLVVVDTIKTGKGPHNTRFTKDGKLAYVTLQGGEGLAVINTTSRKMIRIIPVPGITGPHNLDLSDDEHTAYVRDFVHHVAVVDLISGRVKKIITVGNGHGGIDVTPDGRYVVTAAIGGDYITVINTTSLESRNIKTGNGSHGIRASKDSQWIYVTLTKDNEIAVINVSTMRVEKKIPVGKFPFWIAVNGNP